MKSNQPISLLDRDQAWIWHPYTQHKTADPCLPIIKGEMTYLVDENGKKYIDVISSWWTNIHGHAHPYIAEKIYEQAKQLEHVIFAGFTHPPAIDLAGRILDLLPNNFSKIFYSDNGSTAVEVALKMGIQYWKNKGNKETPVKIFAFHNSYHGDTFGAMSVSERGVFTLQFADRLFEVMFIDIPTKNNIDDLRKQLDLISERSIFIYEPLVQGAGGMQMYDSGLMNELLLLMKERNVICIADEVMTGFGRTGKTFASDYIETKPDIICLSKGITGGSLPLAITACTENIFDSFLSDDSSKTFFHGHSYTANPIACAAALASLDLLFKEDCIDNLQYISERNSAFVKTLSDDYSDKIKNPRSLGTIAAFEIAGEKNDYLNAIKRDVIHFAMENGIILRPLGNTVYIMPPYCITPVQLEKIYSCILNFLGKHPI